MASVSDSGKSTSTDREPWYITAASFIPEQDAILLWQAAQHLNHRWRHAVSLLGLDKEAAERAQKAATPATSNEEDQLHHKAALSVLSLWYYHCRRTMWRLLEEALSEAALGSGSESDAMDCTRTESEPSRKHRLGSEQEAQSLRTSDSDVNGSSTEVHGSVASVKDLSFSSPVRSKEPHHFSKSDHHTPSLQSNTSTTTTSGHHSNSNGTSHCDYHGDDRHGDIATAGHLDQEMSRNSRHDAEKKRPTTASHITRNKEKDAGLEELCAESSDDDEYYHCRKSAYASNGRQIPGSPEFLSIFVDDESASEGSGYQSDDESKDESCVGDGKATTEVTANATPRRQSPEMLSIDTHPGGEELSPAPDYSQTGSVSQDSTRASEKAAKSKQSSVNTTDRAHDPRSTTSIHGNDVTAEPPTQAKEPVPASAGVSLPPNETGGKKSRRKRRRAKEPENATPPLSSPVTSSDMLSNRGRYQQEADQLEAAATKSQKEGDTAGAKKKFHRVLTIRKILFGERHGQLANCYQKLAGILLDEGDFASAKQNLQNAMACLRQHPAEDERRGGLLSLLAYACFKTRNFTAASRYGKEAVNVWESILNASAAVVQRWTKEKKEPPPAEKSKSRKASMALARALQVSARVSMEQADLKTGRLLLQRAVSTLQSWWPASEELHRATALLGRVCVSFGNHEQAEQCFSVLPENNSALGENHLDQCKTVESMAILAVRRQKLPQALGYIQRLLKLTSKADGKSLKEDNVLVVNAVKQMCTHIPQASAPKHGLAALEELMTIMEARFGENHELIGDIYVALGGTYAKLGKTTEARHSYVVAVEFWERHWSCSYTHPLQHRVMHHYIQLCEEQARLTSSVVVNNKTQRVIWLAEGYMEVGAKMSAGQKLERAVNFYTQSISILSSEFSASSGELRSKLSTMLLSSLAYRGECGLGTGDLQTALSDCDMVLASCSSHPRATFVRGCVLFKLGEYLQSHADFIALALLGSDKTDEFPFVEWLNKVRQFTAGRVGQVKRRHVPPSEWH